MVWMMRQRRGMVVVMMGCHAGRHWLWHVFGRWSVRHDVVVPVLLHLRRRQMRVLWWQRTPCTDSRFHTTPLGGQSQFFQSLPTQAITFVLTFLGRQGRFQKLTFNFGPLFVGFGQDAIDFFLLFQSAFPGTIVFSLPTVFVLLPKVHFLIGPLLFGFEINVLNALSQFRGSCPTLSILSRPTVQDFLRRRDARLNVRFETCRHTRRRIVISFFIILVLVIILTVVLRVMFVVLSIVAALMWSRLHFAGIAVRIHTGWKLTIRRRWR